MKVMGVYGIYPETGIHCVHPLAVSTRLTNKKSVSCFLLFAFCFLLFSFCFLLFAFWVFRFFGFSVLFHHSHAELVVEENPI